MLYMSVNVLVNSSFAWTAGSHTILLSDSNVTLKRSDVFRSAPWLWCAVCDFHNSGLTKSFTNSLCSENPIFTSLKNDTNVGAG